MNFIKKSFAIFLVLALLIAFHSNGSAEVGFRRYQNAEQGLSFSVPNHWREMAQGTDTSRENQSNQVLVINQFHLNTDHSYPYVGVQVIQGGAFPSATLNQLRQFHVADIETLFNDTSLTNVQIYDHQSQTVWALMKGKDGEDGTFVNITAMRLTQKGWIQLSYINNSDQYTPYVKEFFTVVNSVQLQKGLDYDPNSSLSHNTNEGIKPAAKRPFRTFTSLMVMSFLIVGLLIRWFTWKKRKTNVEPMALSDIAGDSAIEYKVSDEYLKQSRKKMTRLFFAIMGISVGIAPLLTVVAMLKDERYRNGVLLFSMVGILVLAAVMVWVAYQFGRRFFDRAWSSYRFILSDNSIMFLSDTALPDLKIKREEVQSVEETKKGLMITSRNRRQWTCVPKGLDGYDEIKAKILGWIETERAILQNDDL